MSEQPAAAGKVHNGFGGRRKFKKWKSPFCVLLLCMSSVVVIYFYAISRSGKKQSSAMVFTIYQSEYVSRANINHWMLAVSQINEIIAHNLQGKAYVNARTLQNRVAIIRLQVSKEKQNFLKLRNKVFFIQMRLKQSPYVRLTLSALSKLYDCSFYFENEHRYGSSTKSSTEIVVNHEIFADGGFEKSYSKMYNLSEKILEICNCSLREEEVIDFSKTVLVYNRKKTRRIIDADIERLENLLTREKSGTKKNDSLLKNLKRYKVQNKFIDDQNACVQFCTVSRPYKAIISPHGAQFATFFATYPETLIIEVIPQFYDSGGFNNYVRLSIRNRWFLVENGDRSLIECFSNTVVECYDKLSTRTNDWNCFDRKCQLKAKNVHQLELNSHVFGNINSIVNFS
jgi:hypothetical protein